jgi:hypothetical protein
MRQPLEQVCLFGQLKEELIERCLWIPKAFELMSYLKNTESCFK